MGDRIVPERVVYVTRAQRNAARLLIELRKKLDEPVEDDIVLVANAEYGEPSEDPERTGVRVLVRPGT